MKKILIKDQSGAALIEFAFVAPIFFLLLMGIVELGLFFYAQNVIENATAASARYGITNGDYDNRNLCKDENSRADFIRCSIDKYSRGLLDPADVNIQAQPFNNFNNVKRDNYNFDDDKPKAPDYGGPNQAVVYHVTYKWKFFTPLVGRFFSSDSTYLIQSNVLVKNENFD
ncbi:MAG: TadE family protein [Rickettsiales bacterium]